MAILHLGANRILGSGEVTIMNTLTFTGTTNFGTVMGDSYKVRGEKINASDSALIGYTVSSVTFALKYTSSALTGNITCTILDSSGNAVSGDSFPAYDSAGLTTSVANITFTNSNPTRELANGDSIALYFNGDSTHLVGLERSDGADAFDTTKTCRAYRTGTSGALSVETGEDQIMKINNSDDEKASFIGTSAGSAKFTGTTSNPDTAISIGSGSTALTSTDFTMAFWYKPISVSSPAVQRIYHNGGTGSNRLEIQCYNSKFYVNVGSSTTFYTSVLVNDKAEHWVITNDGGAVSAYRDNVADGTGTAQSATRTDTATAKAISADGEGLNGYMGDFVLTTDVITSAERASLAGGGSASALDNKVLYYPFTTNFEDESGNSYDGTATGNPVTTIDTTVGFPTGSNLPETTLFVETDTKLTWWLQDGVWIRNGKNVTTGSAITVSNQSSATNVTEVATNYIWAAGTDSNYGAGYATGCGNKNNFIFCGGNNSATSSQYLNGTAWTTISMGSSQRKDTGAGAGTATQAIIAGGRNQAGSFMTTNLTWNGSAWTESSSLLSSGHGEHCSGDGNYSDLLVAGGYTSTQVAIVSIWNGTSFASGTSINTASYGANCGGLSSSAIHMTGGAPASANNESNFNGTSWTATSVSIPFAGRHYFSGGGKQDDHLVIGGYSNVTASHTNKTDLWNGTAWVSKDNLSSTRYATAGDVSGGTVEG